MRVNREKLLNTILEVLSIPSPTFQESQLSRDIQNRYFPSKEKSNYQIHRSGDSFIATLKKSKINSKQFNFPHIALVGHLDVVPEFFPPYVKAGKIHGAGASDMKSSVGVFLYLVENPELLGDNYRISFVFYAKEEGTPLEDNGLYELMEKFPDWFRTVDLAIVGEPTDNSVQIGCCGSIHARVRIQGQACHSARPWQGENALYQALPFLEKMKRIRPKAHKVGGVVFKDVCQVTVGQTLGGTTTVPGEWVGNVNFRFAPLGSRRSRKKVMAEFKNFLIGLGLHSKQFQMYSFSPMGKIVETPLYSKVLSHLQGQGMRIEAKQAWTDVAQFGALGIPSFNFGPGLSAQCHKPGEYALEKYLFDYTRILTRLLK